MHHIGTICWQNPELYTRWLRWLVYFNKFNRYVPVFITAVIITKHVVSTSYMFWRNNIMFTTSSTYTRVGRKSNVTRPLRIKKLFVNRAINIYVFIIRTSIDLPQFYSTYTKKTNINKNVETLSSFTFLGRFMKHSNICPGINNE